MAHLRASDLARLVDAIRAIHAHAEGPFHERVFRILGQVFEGSCHSLEMFSRNGDHSAHTNVPVPEDSLETYLARLGEVVPAQHPLFVHLHTGTRDPMRLSDHITQQRFLKTDLYTDIFKPVAVRYQLTIPLYAADCMGGITVNRGHRDFDSEDLMLAGLLAPQIATAFDTQLLLEGLRRPEPPPIQEVPDFACLRDRGLTVRECEVLSWIARGKRDGEIAIILGISVRTVNQHVRGILAKLGVETRTAAVTTALGSQGGGAGAG